MAARMDPIVLWARAALVGSIALFLGVAGHVTADGLLPGPLFLAALLVCSVALSGPMLRRPASARRLVAMLVGGQTLIHLVLSATAGHAGDSAGPASSPATRHGSDGLGTLPVVDGHRVGSLQDAYEGMTAQPSMAPTLPVGHLIDDMSAHAPMMVAHLTAAALVGLWLAHGERCLWTILALTGRRILAVVRPLAPLPRAPQSPTAEVDHTPAVPVSRWQAGPHSRRGPPLLLA
jgi:hypothetical protein